MIVINGRFLQQRLTGTQRYAFELTNQLLAMRDDVMVVAPRGPICAEYGTSVPVMQFGNLRGHLWEQVELPAYLKKLRSPLLLNLVNSAPIHYPNKIVTCHDISFIRTPWSYSLPYRLLYKLMTPPTLRSARAIITVSDFSKREIAKEYGIQPEKIHVLYSAASMGALTTIASRNLVSDLGFEHLEVKKNRFFLAVSSVLPHKNFRGLADAFLDAGMRDVELIVTGSLGSAGAILKKRYAKTAVRFTGRVNDEELVYLYRNALAFVLPSFYEGFGLTPLEAQHFGCPVAVSGLASLPEVYGDSACYFDPKSKESISAALVSISSDQDLRKRLIEKGLDNCKRYSFEKTAEKLEALIRQTEGGD